MTATPVTDTALDDGNGTLDSYGGDQLGFFSFFFFTRPTDCLNMQSIFKIYLFYLKLLLFLRFFNHFKVSMLK
jgi:hypothetical protein